MPQFNILDDPRVQKTLVAKSLLQLFATSHFLKTGVTEGDSTGSFQHNQSASLMRPRFSGEAEEYNPRNPAGLSARSEDPGYAHVTLTLEKLFTEGFPIFSTDRNATRYIQDYSESTASALRKSADRYLYEKCFRLYAIPATGTYRYGGNSPVQLTWQESDSGNLLPMTRNLLISANTTLNRNEVPDGNRYAGVSPDAVGDLFANSPTDEGYVGMAVGGSGLLANGLPLGQFINRHGFMVGNSTVVKGQDAVSNISGGNPSVAIASVANDTTMFLQDDLRGDVPLGAIEITLGAALTPGSLGVGQIIRVGVDGGRAIAYGVVLRLTGNSIFTVLCDQKGRKLDATQVDVSVNRVSVAKIGAVNTAYHREQVCYATRRLNAPSSNSGAVSVPLTDPESGISIQMFLGSYDVDRFKESTRMSVLIGCTPTDHRKSVLMLCA